MALFVITFKGIGLVKVSINIYKDFDWKTGLKNRYFYCESKSVQFFKNGQKVLFFIGKVEEKFHFKEDEKGIALNQLKKVQ